MAGNDKVPQENRYLERKFERLFNAYALSGSSEIKEQKSKIKGPNIIKWFKDAEIIGDDFGMDEDAVKEACRKADKNAKGMELERFYTFVEDIAEENDVEDIKQQLVALEYVTVDMPEIPSGMNPQSYRDGLLSLLFDVYSTMSDKKGALQLEQVKKWFKDAGITGGASRCKSIGEDSVTRCYKIVNDENNDGLRWPKFKPFVAVVALDNKLKYAKLVDDLVKVKTVVVDLPKQVAE